MLDDKQLCAIFLIPFATIGMVCNWSVVYLVAKISTMKHSFGYLSANQAFGDAIHSTSFLLYYCPMAISDNEIMKYFSHHCGFIILLGYEVSIHTHLVISLNRLFSAFASNCYISFFNTSNTNSIIACIWIITLSSNIIFNEILCNLYYYNNSGFLVFTKTPLCNSISWYADFIKNIIIVLVIVITDTATVIKVRFINNKVLHSVAPNTAKMYAKKERNFLKQAVFQGAIFVIELFSYFVLPPLLTSKWSIFLATSFAWVFIHATDGILTMVFNPEIRKFISRNIRKVLISMNPQRIFGCHEVSSHNNNHSIPSITRSQLIF